MRLTSIKLAGFKSFIDASTLPLPSNLTAVVGPNGCGKSNIIDAVRWVLGESSMKQLRSDSMEDVIFNGSKTRKPAGRASIELHFDNDDQSLQGPYASYAEITVRREVTRDGMSQYYLNGAKCLKRDVTGLFLGTGLGARTGYAIIEQGMVSNMIQAKPEELRVWLEEAAGISRYKEKRRETETRIRQTRDNLARLSDLRSELQDRLAALQRQSTNAEKFKAYKGEERRLKAEHLALQLRAAHRTCEAHDERQAALKADVDAARQGVQQRQHEQAEGEARRRDRQRAHGEQQNRLWELDAGLKRQEQALTHARELREIKERERTQVGEQLRALDERRQAEDTRREQLTRSLADLDKRFDRLAAAEAAAREALESREQDAARSQEALEDFQRRADGPLLELEGQRVRLQELERSRAQLREQVDRMASERAALDAAPIQQSLFDADSELSALKRALSDGQAEMDHLDGRVRELREQRSSEDGALHQARESLQAARGRLASLELLQQAALREDDDDLNAWLDGQGLSDAPRLASALRVAPGWEGAVEQVLGGLLQAPLVEDLGRHAASGARRPERGLALVEARAKSAGARPERLSSKVEGPAAVLAWLDMVHVAGDARAAQQAADRLAPGESVVTADGDWWGRGWVRQAPGGDDRQGGTLARTRLLEELRTEVAEHGAAVDRHEQALRRMRAELDAAEAGRRDKANWFDEERSRQAQRLAFRDAQAVRLEQAQTQGQKLEQALDEFRATSMRLQQEAEQSRSRVQALESTAESLRGERDKLQQSQARVQQQVREAREAHARTLAERGELQVERASGRTSLEALDQLLVDLGARHESLEHQRDALEAECRSLSSPIDEQAGALDSARQGVEAEREKLRAAQRDVEAAEEAVQACVKKSREAEFALDGAREVLQQAQIEFQGLDVRRQNLEERLGETDFTLPELLASLADEATPEDWEQKVAAMVRRIERLGPINLVAIQELEEAREREQYLSAQDADLNGALDTLEAAIRKIDVETRERFRETFDQVNGIFQTRFPKLFGGGEASLELTGDNLLETGVRVMARPPGKRNSSIQMLSGGEKAMTAVALLLALFELNPAPFCLLDEVDAPLDDANVARFVEVIREMSGNVQFIIITHNKITMELAEHLHGVTMQEPGVSRMVSVDIQQAVDLAAERESATAAAVAS